MKIIKGLPENFKHNSAELILNTLGDKFIPILGNYKKAEKLIENSFYNQNSFCAYDDSQLLGILAFQVNNLNFINPSFKQIVSAYGIIKGTLKTAALSMLTHKCKKNEIYIEAAAVSEKARGKGIGTKLFEALFKFAEENNFKTVSLQVIGTNPKAKSLYEKLGFRVVKHSKFKIISRIIGWSFNDVYLMEK